MKPQATDLTKKRMGRLIPNSTLKTKEYLFQAIIIEEFLVAKTQITHQALLNRKISQFLIH